MPSKPFSLLAALALSAFSMAVPAAATDAVQDPLTQAIPSKYAEQWLRLHAPQRIHGDTYYVGFGGMSVVLIRSDAGLILIDSALPQSVAALEAHIRQLGFDIKDVKYILNTEAHFDHSGGIAALARDSGATAVASVQGARALRDGHVLDDDPQAGEIDAFPAVARVRSIADGETLKLGNVAITGHATPGHTPGSMSWSWRSCEKDQCRDIVFGASLNAVAADNFRFSAPGNAGVVAGFKQGMQRFASLPCDILITAHPDHSGFDKKLAQAQADPAAFVDAQACRAYAAKYAAILDARLGKERHLQAMPVKIDKLLTPDIGGIKQFVEIKTDDASKPVLLFLSGGPGSSMMKNEDAFTDILKSKFTLVQWDQRDAGKTLKLNPSPLPPSLALMEDDAYQVLQFVIKELGQRKIYLLGSSWGNVLGFDIVKKHPELLHAYFAVNPIVSQLASEKELLGILKTRFKENAAAADELAKVHIPFERDEDLFYLRKWLFYSEGKEYVLSEDFKQGFLAWSKTWSPVWNDVMRIDLSKTLKTIDIPVYFFVGKNDIQTAAGITKKYFDQLQAPKKGLFMFEHSGHQIHQDEPEKFQNTIIKTLD